MTTEQKLMLSSLRSAVTGCPLDTVSAEVDWQQFAYQSGIQSVGPLVWQGLQSAPGLLSKIPAGISAAFRMSYLNAYKRDTQQEHLRGVLTEELNRLAVPHIYLKGSAIQSSYPEPALRTMSDIDLLVYAADFQKIREAASRLGAVPVSGDGNHRIYIFPGDLKVEFHPNMLHHDTAVGTRINPGWQYARKLEDTYRQELTPEGLYLNLICHLAGHFIGNGVTARFLADIWVFRHRRKPEPDWTSVEKSLDEIGLAEFARNIAALSEVWFSDSPYTPVTEELEDYVLSFVREEDSDRSVLNAMSLSPGKSRISALRKRAFYSRAEMEDRYPWCRGKAWLLPAAWCARAFRAVTTHGIHIRRWVQKTKTFSRDDVSRQAELLDRFGLRPDL